jgi:hypothetical protein
MRAERRRSGARLAHRVRGALALAAIAALIVSCRDIVGGSATNALSELCGVLDRCYGSPPAGFDCDTLDARLDSAPLADVGVFLEAFEPSACLDSCPGSRACLDVTPLCFAGQSPCDRQEDCCGFSEGTGDCRVSVEGRAQCCSPPGVRCSDSEECCNGDCEGSFCGGTPCALVGADCGSSFECCSKLCVDGRCSEQNCSQLGQPCLTAGDCCASGDLCENDKCTTPTEPCLTDPCDPAVQDCCAGAFCYSLTGSGAGICGPEECTPIGVDCADNTDCCEGLFCDSTLSICRPDCASNDAPCGRDGDCCSGFCDLSDPEQGSCSVACNPAGCHGLCEEGAPLSAEAPGCEQRAQCIQSVIDADPFCGCVGWDSICVDRVFVHCAIENACSL